MGMVTKYQKRIFGPLLDRVDIQIQVLRVEFKKLSNTGLGRVPEKSGNLANLLDQQRRFRYSLLL
jgi:magnesium chelatase family protein